MHLLRCTGLLPTWARMSLLASLVIVMSVNLASERGRQCSYPIAGAYLPVTGLDYSAASVEVLLFRQHIDRAGFAGSGLCRTPAPTASSSITTVSLM